MSEQNLKWNEKPILIIPLILFFFPLGLYFMWKNQVFSKKVRVVVSIFFVFVIIGSMGNQETSNLNVSDLVGNTYSLDTYHQIKFKTESTYWIYQKPLNCGGDGSWSISGDKLILGPNGSNCESTRKKKGEYSLSKFK
jgi:hypothetical protein